MSGEAEEREQAVRDGRLTLRTRVADAVLNAAAVVACDRDGIIGFWNLGAERLFGNRSDEAMGRSLDLIIPERLRQRHRDGYGRVMLTGKTRYGEGDVLAVPALHNVPLKNESGIMIGMAAILRDVTMRFEEIRTLKRRLADATKSSG